MTRTWRALALSGVLGVLGPRAESPAMAQDFVGGGSTVVMVPPAPTGREPVVQARRTRRSRNRYYAARPNYAPTPPGTRAKVTFEPFTRWYYPNQNSYYPPLPVPPSARGR